MQPDQESRRVLTFFIDKTLYIKGETEYMDRSMRRGQMSLNEAVNDFARRVPVHSISYMQVALSVAFVRLSATVLYSGPSALAIYGPQNPHGPGSLSDETTLIGLWEKGSTI